MPSDSPIRIVVVYFAWFLCGIAILMAIPFLLISLLISEHSLAHHIIRDIGIAFLVAVIVAAIYELHARSRFDIETMTGVFNTVMQDVVRPDIWSEVKAQVIEKVMIREDVNIKFEILNKAELQKTEPNLQLPSGAAVLWMKFEYDLYSLRSGKWKGVPLSHSLDDHIPHGNLPCFTKIVIGDKSYPTHNVEKGEFTTGVDLEPKGGHPIHVITERREIAYLPGSYNLTMWELTKGITLSLSGALPDGIEVSVNIRPHTEKALLELHSDLEFKNILLLPGQGIEFRFKRNGD